MRGPTGAEIGGTDQRQAHLRYNMAVQTNRAVVYTFAVLVGLLFVHAEVLRSHYLDVLSVLFLANLSALVLWLFYRFQLSRSGPPRNLHFLWIICDGLLVTWGVHVTGDLHSPWFPWYLANISGAAFVVNQWWGFGAAFIDTLCYVLLLVAIGDIRGLDSNLTQVLFRMASLYGASFFFLRGASDLQKKRATIKQLKEAESRKVEELTRLTLALDQRTRELAEANQKTRQADRMKSQFLANMSHELRTPLNSIIGFSEVLVSRLEGQITGQYLQFLRNIRDSGHHLLGIINDILDLSKVEAGKMEVNHEPLSMNAAVAGVLTVMKGLAAQRGIHFSNELPEGLPPLEADPVKVKQILYNLLSNAVKFSHEGGTVALRGRHLPASQSPLACESMEIGVEDEGLGIPVEEQEAVFQEFHQVDGSLTRRFGGTGLGLALTRRFVELHGGTIALTSRPGEGSTFTVTLPLRRRDAAGTDDPEVVEAGPVLSGRPRVLVVEDDPSTFEAIARTLAEDGFDAVRARTGEEALHLARSQRPVAVTLDIILPSMDGWAVLKDLKGDPHTSALPVIILSVQDNRELGLALGADDYFLKPVDPADLVRKLRELVRPGAALKPRILVIDDDRPFQDLVEQTLEPAAYDLLRALTGKDGIERARLARPDLIILDLMMEGMDGFEVAAHLSSDPTTRRIPILVLTAKELTREDRERLKGKIEALLRKGGQDLAGLNAVIRDLVRRRRESEDAAT